MGITGSGQGGGINRSGVTPTTGSSNAMKPDVAPLAAGSSSRARCFSCGESGHRFADCKRGPKKGLFVDSDDVQDEVVDAYTNPTFDDATATEEEQVEGDCGPLLVVRRSCLAPRSVDDDWLRTNVFQSTCTIGGKICRFIVDSGSCENVISEETVRKLQLATEAHPRPYKLTWLDKRNDVTVVRRCLVSFSIGATYKDKSWCDVIAMDACHLLLGRPWLYDRKVIYDGFLNTYSFSFNSIKITLLPKKEATGSPPSGDSPTLLSLAKFEAEVRESGIVYVLLGREQIGPSVVPGVLNRVADALSRRRNLLVDMRVKVLGFDSFQNLYAQDSFFAAVLQKIEAQHTSDFVVHDGFIFKGNLLCIPTCILRAKMIQELHDEGHVGRDRTYQLLAGSYFWPTMRKEVGRFVERCRVCQVSKGGATNAAPEKHVGMEIEDKVALKAYRAGGRDTRVDRRGPGSGGMGELIGTVSDGRLISGEVVGTGLGSVSVRGKVGRRRVYTIPGLNRSGRGVNSSKQGRILISGNDSTCVEKKY
ncbi:hypothetical protein LWI29_022353 [Acer saccharum]|uniref:CCHC-type domain-containing protein n=1 Tax=Acer saccharum TaxID=4024 RepID=A0AA39T710_ACESA|nr:hypothetical protein LWI29_022353 [Acer saccharum]